MSFSALYSLSALTSVVQILVLPIEGLSTWLELPILLTLNVPLFIYGFIISISALCKGTNASTAFVLSGMLLTFLILVLVSAAMHILGIEAGILLLPNDFAANGHWTSYYQAQYFLSLSVIFLSLYMPVHSLLFHRQWVAYPLNHGSNCAMPR